MVNNLLRLSLQVWNSGMGLGGIATIVYGIFIFRAAGPESDHITIPWFFHAFLFAGIVLCAVSCLGHFAANTANTCCLSTYVGIILGLLILETLIMTDAFFNPKWKKDFQSGKLDDFMESVVSTDYVFKYLAFMVFLVQAICVLLAALSIHDRVTDGYESEFEDEDEQPRVALLYSIARWQQSERYIV